MRQGQVEKGEIRYRDPETGAEMVLRVQRRRPSSNTRQKEYLARLRQEAGTVVILTQDRTMRKIDARVGIIAYMQALVAGRSARS
jgi:hypothetical protein